MCIKVVPDVSFLYVLSICRIGPQVPGKHTLLPLEIAIRILIEFNDLCTFLLDLGSHAMNQHVPPYLAVRFQLLCLACVLAWLLCCLRLCLRFEFSFVLESHGEDFLAVFNHFAGTSEHLDFVV